MASEVSSLWELVRKGPQIDPNDLALAIQSEVTVAALDYRSRLLVRDAAEALRSHWGDSRFDQWLVQSPGKSRIQLLCEEAFEEVGYPSIGRRLMEKTRPEDVCQFLFEVGEALRTSIDVYIGGVVPLILSEQIVRHTEDIHVVGEVPQIIRENYDLLDRLQTRYGLHFGSVRPHYYPRGWQERSHYVDTFGELRVYVLDAYDIFLGKLSSTRDKDRDDLRVLARQLDKESLRSRLPALLKDFGEPLMLERILRNWRYLYGESLPS